jgi:hypothetical protein
MKEGGCSRHQGFTAIYQDIGLSVRISMARDDVKDCCLTLPLMEGVTL